MLAPVLAVVVLVAGGVVYANFERSRRRIVLATTTSTYDSGLLDYLLPEFERESGVRVEVVSVGTGQALAVARSGDADVVLVHAREQEDQFVAEGHGVHRVCVMYNDFLVVGPPEDPAGVKGASVENAMARLAEAGRAGNATFFSRGDGSGTHARELALWETASVTVDPTSSWYLETGSGMGTTLTVASESGGYTLVDRGTWLSMKDSLDLQPVVEGDAALLNPYGAILVNPQVHPSVNFEAAREFVAFLVSRRGQEAIGNFTKAGETLFHPSFGACNVTHGCPTTAEELAYWTEFNMGYRGGP
ncbi:MAG: extracellular solute-binding protein [Promethearchaeota archaeon]